MKRFLATINLILYPKGEVDRNTWFRLPKWGCCWKSTVGRNIEILHFNNNNTDELQWALLEREKIGRMITKNHLISVSILFAVCSFQLSQLLLCHTDKHLHVNLFWGGRLSYEAYNAESHGLDISKRSQIHN